MTEERAPLTEETPEKKLREELLRLAADFDNYRKEVARERELWRDRTLDEAVLIFLPIDEALERAAAEENSESLRHGRMAVLGLVQATLSKLGCSPISSLGQDIDPLYHEAVLAEHSPEPKNKILAEIERGWMRNGRVLRPAKVKVSLGPKGGEAQ